ncbi:MAG: stage IV sporulation protein A [Eubacteriales bacterium]|nr:stage IV sporulation protein A [Eubacteriales bacterium]
MTNTNIYHDIAKRTHGDIYIGVVGPVRSGKSTFIKRFMEEAVIPNINDFYDKQRTVDVMPQSADGRAVMTTEPKFIPDEAVKVNIGNNMLNVKMIDCVGYVIPEAITNADDGTARMVMTPWSKTPMPFTEAAEIGTKKVIRDHSTIAMMITTDGTIGEFPRKNYEEAEMAVVSELKKSGKPYAIIINSSNPSSEESVKLAYELENKYGAPVALINCMKMDSEDIEHILALTLDEFPVLEMKFTIPAWARNLPSDHWLKKDIINTVRSIADGVSRMGDIARTVENLPENKNIESIKTVSVSSGDGVASLNINLDGNLYYKVLSELTGFEIKDDAALISIIEDLAKTKREYDKVAEAIAEVNEKGYGIVMPDVDDLRLQEPQIIKKAGSYGVKLRAAAQSVHMIRADIETEINPIVGTEEQSEELVKYLLREFEEDPKKIWDSNIFGKSLYELVNEGLHAKLEHMPEESREKLSETLERIINEGSGGLICILL